MYNQYTLPLMVTVQPPVWMLYWLYFIHLGIIPLLFVTSLEWYFCLLLVILVLFSLYHNLCIHVYQSASSSILRVLVNDENEWWITMANGKTCQAELLPVNLVHARLIILGFRCAGKTAYAILTPNAGNSDILRRLRVRMRFPCKPDELK